MVRAYHRSQNKLCCDICNLHISCQLHDKLITSCYFMKFLSITWHTLFKYSIWKVLMSITFRSLIQFWSGCLFNKEISNFTDLSVDNLWFHRSMICFRYFTDIYVTCLNFTPFILLMYLSYDLILMRGEITASKMKWGETGGYRMDFFGWSNLELTKKKNFKRVSSRRKRCKLSTLARRHERWNLRVFSR